MNHIKFLLPIIFLISVFGFLGSCKDKNDDPKPGDSTDTNNNVAMGDILFHLHTYLDIDEVDAYNITYTTPEGRKISLTKAQLYISNIKLTKLDGSVYTMKDTIVLQEQETETYLVGKAPAGNYKKVSFTVGFDSSTNSKSPAGSWDVRSRSEMWFGATPQPEGYVFLNLQGKIDTTSDYSGTVQTMQPFVYKIGTPSNSIVVNMPESNFSVMADEVTLLHLLTDYNKLFKGVQLNIPDNLTVSSLADNSKAVAIRVKNNIPSMFSFE